MKKTVMSLLALALLSGCAAQQQADQEAETADAMQDKADQILEDAQKEAEKIKEDARKEAEQIKADAQKEADDAKAKAEEEEKAAEEKKEEEAAPAAVTPQPAGTTIERDGLAYTFESVEYTEGNDIFKPKEGNTFANCLIKIENKTDQPVEYLALSRWEMISPTGAYENATIGDLGDDKKILGDDKIAPGGFIEGYLSFDEPKEGKLILVVNTDEYPPEEIGQWIVRE